MIFPAAIVYFCTDISVHLHAILTTVHQCTSAVTILTLTLVTVVHEGLTVFVPRVFVHTGLSCNRRQLYCYNRIITLNISLLSLDHSCFKAANHRQVQPFDKSRRAHFAIVYFNLIFLVRHGKTLKWKIDCKCCAHVYIQY